jgi:phage terminase small subunit
MQFESCAVSRKAQDAPTETTSDSSDAEPKANAMRGRRAVPDEIKALKGNPGRRPLGEAARTVAPPIAPVWVPEFLVGEREITIYRRVVDDYVQRRIARQADLNAYGRYAYYLNRWIGCAEQLVGKATWFQSESRWGKLLRRHPVFKDQLDLERVIQSLEDRLGLNPVSRQNIIRGLSTLPPALGGLFASEPPEGEPSPVGETPELPESPVGFLQRAAEAGSKMN